jgi:hypothetical protein
MTRRFRTFQAQSKEATQRAEEGIQGTSETMQGMADSGVEDEEAAKATIRGSGHQLRLHFIVQRLIVDPKLQLW